MLTIYAPTTQTFFVLLILFFIFCLIIFIAFLSYILPQIPLLHTSNLQFYTATDFLHPITKLGSSRNIHLSSQATSGLIPEMPSILVIHPTYYLS